MKSLLFATFATTLAIYAFAAPGKFNKWVHRDLNDQNVFHSTIDALLGVPGVSKKPDNQTEVHSGVMEC